VRPIITPLRPPQPTQTRSQVYLLSSFTKTLKTFMWEAFGARYGEGCEPNCIYDNYANIGFFSPEVPRALWIWFVKPVAMQGDGNFLHPIPLQVAIAQNGEGPRAAARGCLLLLSLLLVVVVVVVVVMLVVVMMVVVVVVR